MQCLLSKVALIDRNLSDNDGMNWLGVKKIEQSFGYEMEHMRLILCILQNFM